MNFFDEPVSGVVAKCAHGRVSSRELVSAALGRIAGRDKELHSFLSVQPEAALSRADFIDRLAADVKKTMPLCGIPVAVKDNIVTEGVPTTCASKILENFVPPYNATVVDALLAAGAVIVGKTNLDEFAMGSSTENSYFGPTKNPNDPGRIPGGSSGGSAAAVAAGLVPLALGSDTGGSIRQPCCHCGCAGLKPTYGRVSRYGLVAFASSLDQIGPIAAVVRDIGLLLMVLSVPDKRDSTCAGKQFVNSSDLYTGGASGLTVGVPTEYFGEGLSAEVRGPIESLLDKLKTSGCKTVPVSLPNLGYGIATYYIICTAEASSNLARYDGVKYGYRSAGPKSLIDMYQATRREGFGAEVKRRIML
ncbi:MAG TPA: amidase family protein, partial [Chitinivibrionales bacterium]|nr:amidase family protein [Chitinivibrionales bacterium]